MATLEAFLPYVEPHLLGAPLPGLLHEIRQAAVTFCERTRVWKARGTLSITAGVAEYAIPGPANSDPVIVESAFLGDTRLDPVTPDDLKRLWQHWEIQTGPPQVYTQFTDAQLTLVPTPNTTMTDGLSVQACFKPSRTAGEVPDLLLNRYAEAIGHGAIARVLETRGNPYGDPRLAVYHREHFERGIHQALMQAARGFTRAPLRTRAYF